MTLHSQNFVQLGSSCLAANAKRYVNTLGSSLAYLQEEILVDETDTGVFSKTPCRLLSL